MYSTYLINILKFAVMYNNVNYYFHDIFAFLCIVVGMLK